MNVSEVLMQNYLPYAKDVIMARAIPAIDGLKPVQRRILYTMYQMKLLTAEKTKSANIVGSTMHLHPHGDGAIYEAMVRMTESNGSLNIPYVDGKGNFGKVYSKKMAYAASRYTEAKLAKICNEMFDGIDEDAVEMLPSYDATSVEPQLLPVKFPTILVNPSNGIAVAMSSSIPSFALKNVCEATIGVLNETIDNPHSLMDTLGSPDFSTGGIIHATKDNLYNLSKTGRQTLALSGKCLLYPNKIVITEIPYNTTSEDIIEAVEEHIKDKTLTEVSNINDETDLGGLKIVIDLKSRVSSRDVLRKICRMTKMHTPISFNTRVIIENDCQEIGIYDLLLKWIDFRKDTIKRINEYRLNKANGTEHYLEAWEKIKLDIRDVARLIADKNETGAKEALMSNWHLSSDQAEYILDMKIRLFTQDNLKKKLDELAKTRADILTYKSIIASDDEKKKIIIADLTRIKEKYAKDRRCSESAPIPLETLQEEKHVASDEPVQVILTKKGYLKRVSLLNSTSFQMVDGDEEKTVFDTRNNEYLLVFTWAGEMRKILVDEIDASRAKARDTVVALAALQNSNEIMYILPSGDYTGHFNIVYGNGRGIRVNLNKGQGARGKYKGLYEPCVPGRDLCTQHDKFFLVTAGRKGAYADLTYMKEDTARVAFKVARINTGDTLLAILPDSGVPYPELIDYGRYSKGYTVKIGYDELCGTRLTLEDLIKSKTKKAIKQMIDKKAYNVVPSDLAKYYDPELLTYSELTELGLEVDMPNKIYLLPKTFKADNTEQPRVNLILKGELQEKGE